MALLKCKMCGGNLEVTEGSTICVCEYCGTKQTVPSLDGEKKLNLFQRANRLRFNSEFDKAYSVYESIIADYPEEAEAYWGLILCKYGVEYVDDPKTAKKVPTCHRSSFESILDDPNYELTLEYSDLLARTVYRDEVKALEEIRKGIIEISSHEEPYDIFICYKETDDKGGRTIDSVIAQDVYDALSAKGYRVFFARITLEDKLGIEYEPYIFSALHSSRIMLVFGTDYEYFNAVWVKNEWSRFLKLIEEDKEKTLIPCYKDIDAYDMPKEFRRLQAQDMGKVGAMQDLLRGIDKIMASTKKQETIIVTQSTPQTVDFFAPILAKAKSQLQNLDYSGALSSYQKVLDFMPNNSEALLGVFLSERKKPSIEAIANGLEFFDNTKAYQDFMLLCDDKTKDILKNATEKIKQNNIEKMQKDLSNKNFDSAMYCANTVLSKDPENEDALLGSLLAECQSVSVESLPLSNKLISKASTYQKCIESTSYKQKVLDAQTKQNERIEAEKKAEEAKKQKKRKILAKTSIAVIIVITIVASIVAIYFKSNHYLFGVKYENGEAIVTTYKGNKTKIEIPSKIMGKPVTKIERAEEGDHDWRTKSVIIPDSVTTIGKSAFEGCEFLTSVVIGEGVTSIGERAFYDCTSLTSITIPDSVTSIGESAFKGCNFLTNVDYGGTIEQWCNKEFVSPLHYDLYIDGELVSELVIPNSVTEIKAYSLAYCTSLTSITIPDGVTSIGNSAFKGCTSLTSITIPESVTSIGKYAFYDCTALTEINFNAKAMNDLSSGNQVFYNAGKNGKGIKVTIGKDVTKIPAYLFYPKYSDSLYSSKITSVTFEEGGACESIGNHAFEGCTRLTSITIPDSVTSIGSDAFEGCTRLTSITIPNSVISIGDYAFFDCTSLTSIEIPDSVTSIGSDAFFGCTRLTSITIPDSVTSIENFTFKGCTSLTSVTIGDNVTSIGNSAFKGCTSLTSVTIGDNVTSIGNSAFKGCTSLTSVIIPDGVTSIGNSAFSDCTRLTSVIIPDGVTSIGNSAFSDCTRLTSVTFDDPNGWYVAYTQGATSGTDVYLSYESINATYLTSTYHYYYWYKK